MGRTNAALSGRRAAIRRVFSNLIENAVRYGGSAASWRSTQAPYALTVTVSDNGPGIPPESFRHGFRAFPEARDLGQPGERGYGLGTSDRQGHCPRPWRPDLAFQREARVEGLDRHRHVSDQLCCRSAVMTSSVLAVMGFRLDDISALPTSVGCEDNGHAATTALRHSEEHTVTLGGASPCLKRARSALSSKMSRLCASEG